MKLADYLAAANKSHREFAVEIGVSAEAVRLYLKGDRRPRPAVLQAIQVATGDKVMPNDFFEAA